MASFEYEAIDQNGKTKKGSLEAKDSKSVRNMLKTQNMLIVKITEQNMLNKDINITIGKLVSSRDLAIFCRQFKGIINAGVPITKALSMLAEQTENKHLSEAVRKVQSSVEKGESLASAMESQPKVFPEILVNMVAAGEASGSLEVSFDRMTTHFEKSDKLKSTVKQAMLYPVIVIIVSILVIAVMMIAVIPNFMDMFDEIDAELPVLTKGVIAVSNFMVHRWYVVLLVIAGIIALCKLYVSTADGRYHMSELALKLPLFGKLVRKSAAATFSRTLSTLMAAGIPTIDAVEITAKVMDNKVFKKVLYDVKDEVERGVPLSEPLEASGEFPPMVFHMIRIGEETGNMEPMLDKIADFYEEEVEIAAQTMTTIMEPIIIIILAVIIGTICLAVLSPMFTLYAKLSETS